MKHPTNVLTLLLLTGGCALSAHAQDTCSQIKSAIAAAPNQFAKYKGAWDQDLEGWGSSWTFDSISSDDCFVSYDEDDGYSVRCSQDASSFEDAKSIAQDWADQVEECLKPKVQVGQWNESTRNGSTYSFHTSLLTIEAPTTTQFDAEIVVGAVCSTRKKTGVKTCRASVDVELKGDEKS